MFFKSRVENFESGRVEGLYLARSAWYGECKVAMAKNTSTVWEVLSLVELGLSGSEAELEGFINAF